MQTLKDRLSERSTWAAIVTILGLVGYEADIASVEAIIMGGLTAVSVIFGVTKD